MTHLIHPQSELPGTDPRFHESRNYLSPVMYKGREILASHGSCKQDGCGYSSAWTSNSARDRGMWMHRALHVRELRMKYFFNLTKDNAKSAIMFMETADKNSHTYGAWLGIMRDFFFSLLGDDAELNVPDYKITTKYHLGVGAKDAAESLLDEVSKIKPQQ